MRDKTKVLALGVVIVGIATATYVPFAFREATRGVWPILGAVAPAGGPFRREESAALFVGVRRFTHEEILEVPYAVDDAIDLAYTFAMCGRVHLVPPQRVVLALSGRPKKPESQQRLHELEEAGAEVEQADAADILAQLQRQAARAGPNGILIVSLATHGFARDGISYILGASSRVREPETTISTAKILATIGSSRAQRSLVLIDACREHMIGGTRTVTADAMSSLLFRRMRRVHGQAVLFAAAEGQVAYDGDGNGVFTKAVVQGLQQCEAAVQRGTITADTLKSYVNRQVLDWIRAHRDASAQAGIQWSFDSGANNMPLATCGGAPVGGSIARLSTKGSTVTAFTATGERAWERGTGEPLQGAEVCDLDADRSPEVLAATGHSLVVFDGDGNRVWTAADDHRPLRAFAVADRYHKKTKEVVALWGSTHLVIYASDGRQVAACDFGSRLDYLAVDRPTWRHAPKIVVAGGSAIAVFTRNEIEAAEPLWSRTLSHRITGLTTTDDGDGHRQIEAEMSGGGKVVLDFDGQEVSHRR